MMDNRVSYPERLPSAGLEYSKDHMDRLVTVLDQHLSRLNGRRKLTGTTLNLSDLPTSSAGLKPGDVYNDAGVLKIVT